MTLSKVIFSAWKLGARFDAWQDRTDFNIWNQAFNENGIQPEFYSHRTRNIDEAFPWDHIDTGVRRNFLAQEYQNSNREVIRDDCSRQCHACGILTAFRQERKDHPVDLWKCPDTTKEMEL